MAQDARFGDRTERGNEACCETDSNAERGRSNGRASAADVESDVDALKTLGGDTRYRIVRLLVAEEDELCVCEITPRVEVSDSAVSHALSDLVDAGLLSRRKQGTWRYYRPTDRATRLVEALDATRGDGE